MANLFFLLKNNLRKSQLVGETGLTTDQYHHIRSYQIFVSVTVIHILKIILFLFQCKLMELDNPLSQRIRTIIRLVQMERSRQMKVKSNNILFALDTLYMSLFTLGSLHPTFEILFYGFWC